MERRLYEHDEGVGDDLAYTKSRRPVQLVYKEPFQFAEDAIAREKQIKKWSRAKKQALIAGKISRLKQLSSCKNFTQHMNFEYDRGMIATRPQKQNR